MRKPVITDIVVYGCARTICNFYIYFEPPPDGAEISAYTRPSDSLTWSSVTISDPEDMGDTWRVSAECNEDADEIEAKIMFKTTDPHAPFERGISDPVSFMCSSYGKPTTPVIDRMDVYYCSAGLCYFHVYFKSLPYETLPAGIDAQLYLNDVCVPSKLEASDPPMYRLCGQCTEGGTFAVQLCFQSVDGELWSKRFLCECGLGGGIIGEAKRIAPNIRNIDVYFCDENECYFHVYFDPPPDGAEVEVYMNGTLIPTTIEISSGIPRAPLQYMKGESVSVRLAFITGPFRTRGPKVICECALFAGMDTEVAKVFSSNVKAAGWHRWLESHNPKSPYYVDRQWNPRLDPRLVYPEDMELDSAQVCRLLSTYEMSEEEARDRLCRMGYTPEDVEYLMILNSPD